MSAPAGTVHIVDDDASFRKSLERLLRVRGYQTEAFESADLRFQIEQSPA